MSTLEAVRRALLVAATFDLSAFRRGCVWSDTPVRVHLFAVLHDELVLHTSL